MRDLFSEIVESLKRNKLRTSLTGFSVAWGIFMIIVLLGAGNGLLNAFNNNKNDVLTNTMQVEGWFTSKPYDGLESGRYIQLKNKDKEITESSAFSENIDNVTASLSQGGMTANYGKNYISGNMNLQGIYPEYEEMNKVRIVAGRPLNPTDIKESKKVALLAMSHVKMLTDGGTDYKSMVGEYVKVGNVSFKIVGVYKSNEDSMWESMYIPFTTMRTIFQKGDNLETLVFSFHGLSTKEENEAFESRYRRALNANHRVDPEDNSAIWIDNRYTQNMQMETATNILQVALWIIGLFTLLSGVVGVSNIMLITVKERTHEFGIRKAIGASPWQVTKLILAESVSITAIFGYLGMILGLLACEVLDATVGQSTMELMDSKFKMIEDPTVGIDVALEATLLLVVAGTLAGLFPALKAAKVRPIEALRVN